MDEMIPTLPIGSGRARGSVWTQVPVKAIAANGGKKYKAQYITVNAGVD